MDVVLVISISYMQSGRISGRNAGLGPWTRPALVLALALLWDLGQVFSLLWALRIAPSTKREAHFFLHGHLWRAYCVHQQVSVLMECTFQLEEVDAN